MEMLAHGRANEMLDTLFERYEAYVRGKQLVVVEGTHEDGPIGAPLDAPKPSAYNLHTSTKEPRRLQPVPFSLYHS